MSKTSRKDKIRAIQDIKSELVPIPEWDETLEVRSLSVITRNKLYGTLKIGDKATAEDTTQFEASLVILGTFDPDTGERLFDDTDRDWLVEKNSAPMLRLAAAIRRLSGLTTQAEDDALKNLKKTHTSATNTN